MGMAALIMSASILLSRFMGLLRDKVISWQFGASGEADMYFAAFVVPDFINYLLAGGYVSITLMPLLSQKFAEDEADAWRFFSSIFWWALSAVSLLSILAFIFAMPLAKIVAPGFDALQSQRLAHFLRIIVPAQIFFVSGACFSAILFLRKQFVVPALTPLIYNGCIIVCGIAMPYLGLATGMEGFCYGVSLGAALGAFILPYMAVFRGGVTIHFLGRHALMKRFLFIALPLMLGQSVVMLNEQFLRIFGSYLDAGAVSLLSYARRISQVPVGMVAQAVAVASYPFLASLAAKKEYAVFAVTLRTASNNSTAILLPLSAWMIATAVPTMGFIFEGGSFAHSDTIASAPLLQLMLLAVPFWGVQMVLGRGFYSLGDTLTPALCGTVVTVVSLPIFYWCLPWGTMGIAVVSLLGVVAYITLIMYVWYKRQGAAAFEGLLTIVWQGSFLSLVAGVVAYVVSEKILLVGSQWPSIWPYVLALGTSFLAFLIVYVGIAKFFFPNMLRPLMQRFAKKA